MTDEILNDMFIYFSTASSTDVETAAIYWPLLGCMMPTQTDEILNRFDGSFPFSFILQRHRDDGNTLRVCGMHE